MGDADFSGYATKAGLVCSDGRTITPQAFQDMDGKQVPLVWQHGHNDPENVLGHVKLEARDDGLYCYGFFNDTPKGQHTKLSVQHGDLDALSIWANNLVEKSKKVIHGKLREVSVCLAGANPGAKIDQVKIAHSDDPDDFHVLEDEAVISMGAGFLEHAMKTYENQRTTTSTTKVDGVVVGTHTDVSTSTETRDVPDGSPTSVAYSDGDEEDEDKLEHADGSKISMRDVLETLNDEQRTVVEHMVAVALEGAADKKSLAQSEDSTDSTTSTTQTDNPEGELAHQEGTNTTMARVFDQTGTDNSGVNTLSHDDVKDLLGKAKEFGTFRKAFEAFASEKNLAHSELAHSITNLELMFPDAKNPDGDTPQWVSRRMEWVSGVLNGVKHSPFAKVKTLLADITGDEARAKGYVKGNLKTEEVLVLLRRTTGPATIYKKQKLDRDDILDITDINVVLWLKAEMRIMIEEELARAILVGDGRSALSPDKVKDPMGAVNGEGIRSVLHDSDLFSVKFDLAANVDPKDAVKGLIRARSKYRGTGKPTLYIGDEFLTEIMLDVDKMGRSLYETEQALADKLRVKEIVTVDLFNDENGLFAIMVSLPDYTIGTNAGGQLTSFQDFDIDYNQEKYLQETRLSGALTKPFSAVVVRRAAGTEVVPTTPSFNGETNTIAVPTKTGVVYTIDDTVVTGNVVITKPTEIESRPADGHYFPFNTTRSWNYTP